MQLLSLPDSSMTNIVETILQRKLLEQETLQREIDALRVAAKLVKESTHNSTTGTTHKQTHTSIAELNRERMEQVIGFMKANGGEANTKQLELLLHRTKEAIREWMQRRITELGDHCPWIQGKNSYHFKLREVSPYSFQAAA